VSSAPPSFNLVVFWVVMPCGLTRSYQRSWTSLPLRTAFLWVITQRVVVISYRRFGTTYRSLNMGPDRLSRNVGTPSPLLPRNNPVERSSHLRGGSLKSPTRLYLHLQIKTIETARFSVP